MCGDLSSAVWTCGIVAVLQVSLGGLAHSLSPIAAACPAVHIIERPTRFQDALWLPYRRDHAELQAALCNAGPIKAVFAHADVVSAPTRHPLWPQLAALSCIASVMAIRPLLTHGKADDLCCRHLKFSGVSLKLPTSTSTAVHGCDVIGREESV